jgi:hypothetical protein
MLKILITGFLVLTLNTSLCAEGIPCWLRCRNPPAIQSATDLATHLRVTSNPPVSFFARSTGFLTTYLGKMLGIQGWRDYRMTASVCGTVVQAVGSTDGFYTVDLAIQRLTIGDLPVILQHASFIRVEVLPSVKTNAPLPLKNGVDVRISGELMWDADGFLEIHPRQSHEIEANVSHCP